MLINILLVLIAIAALLLIVSATRPNTFQLERSVLIMAPPERIYPLIASVREMSRWNPFEAQDPALNRQYSAVESGPSSAIDFVGRKAGTGRLEVREAVPPSRVTMQLIMQKPLAASNRIDFSLLPQGGATQVTWAMNGPVSLFGRVLHLVINMDRMLGGQFESGLASLKALAERR